VCHTYIRAHTIFVFFILVLDYRWFLYLFESTNEDSMHTKLACLKILYIVPVCIPLHTSRARNAKIQFFFINLIESTIFLKNKKNKNLTRNSFSYPQIPHSSSSSSNYGRPIHIAFFFLRDLLQP